MDEHRFTIRGEPVRWRYTRLRGSADGYARFEPREVILHSGLTGRRRLECELHEAIHQAFYDLDEKVVLEVGQDFAKILWKLGYRLAR